jgi:hypothetical protein
MVGETPESRNRSTLLLMAVARDARGALDNVVVRNLSPSGLKGEMNAPPRRDDRLLLNLGRAGWVGADVVWVKGRQFGARFHSAIDPEKARRRVPQASMADRKAPAESRKLIG